MHVPFHLNASRLQLLGYSQLCSGAELLSVLAAVWLCFSVPSYSCCVTRLLASLTCEEPMKMACLLGFPALWLLHWQISTTSTGHRSRDACTAAAEMPAQGHFHMDYGPRRQQSSPIRDCVAMLMPAPCLLCQSASGKELCLSAERS